MEETARRAQDPVFPALTATAEHCQGLLADAGTFESHFLRALDLYAHLDLPVNTARAELAFGERLRRAGRRVDARTHLRRALDLFEVTGAELWIGRTRTDLHAAGDEAPARAPSPWGSLTAQESQVAQTIADGATNREAATTLFLSEKTIEMHLTRVYRKLGLRSRTELARTLSEQPGRR